MSEELEKLKKSAREHSDNLVRLGAKMSEIKFNYKILENNTERYWENRINEFKKYKDVGTEYYTEAHALIYLADKEQAGLFLLSMSKLNQIELKLILCMEEVRKNPSIVKSKDKQQSEWSKKLREKLIESSDECNTHEKNMNKVFREFYEKHLKNIIV